MKSLQWWKINIVLLVLTVVWVISTYVFTINALAVLLKLISLEVDWLDLIGSASALFVIIQAQRYMRTLLKKKGVNSASKKNQNS